MTTTKTKKTKKTKWMEKKKEEMQLALEWMLLGWQRDLASYRQCIALSQYPLCPSS
jgi:hypothetical protein